MSKSLSKIVLQATIAIVALVVTGCGDDSGGTSTSMGCDDCTGGLMHTCVCDGLNPLTQEACWASPAACNSWCQSQVGQGAKGYHAIPCGSNDSGMSCSSWSPSSNVRFSGGVYLVLDAFVDDLIRDPEPLWGCDNGVFQPLSGGGAELINAGSTDLVTVLGLEDGDVPLSVNGLPLDDLSDAMYAFAQLYHWDEETELELRVLRNSQVIALDYEIVASF